ncbi:MAG: FAD-dependent oxidoreductase [Clostridia bacterium]|nr:FAD-dependent oxidoreductase [Clostridia bacterium]
MADISGTKVISTRGMSRVIHETDFCVVGGGLSGLCAAVAAAREGIKVVLMQDRPMLGGNASSEIRVWVRGAKGLHNRETGILSEIEEDNIHRNPELNYSVWDTVLWEKVRSEKNIELILNCSCCDAETVMNDGKSRILSVTGWQTTTYTWHTVRAKYFADCSGDSVLAPISGARWRSGREAHAEYGETFGPIDGDSKTMGNSILIEARETGRPVKFVRPDFAYYFEKEEDFNFRCDRSGDALRHGMPVADAHRSISDQSISVKTTMSRPCALGTDETNFWWIELGGDSNSLLDAEQIRDELLRTAYGIWDFVKNRGTKQDATNWDIEWIGFLPGKRESRRYIGKYVMTEHDVASGGKFDDTVAYGGWPMDDHNPAGFRSFEYSFPPSVLYPAPSPYGIPYRVLYGEDVENLFFAGRNISVTHAALSSTRVMATCALIGQAAGTAAGMCVNENETPDGLYEHRIRELQSKLLDAGCMIPGRKREIPALSLDAKLNLSDADRAVLFNGIERPDAEGTVNYVDLPADGSIVYDFGKETRLSELRLVFDPDFSRKSISDNRKMRVFTQTASRGFDFRPVRVAATLVKAFDVIADGKTVFSDEDNFHSLVRIPLDIRCSRLEIRLRATNGAPRAHVFSADVR